MWSCNACNLTYNNAAAAIIGYECACGEPLFNSRGEQHSRFDDPEQVLPSEY